MTSAFQIWSELTEARASEPGWHARRLAAQSGAGILLAIREPEKVPALLVEVPTAAVPPVAEYPSAEGFRVYGEPIEPGPQGRVRLCLVLADSLYREVFGALVDDVIGDIRDRTEEIDLVRAVLARLRVWQVFMRRHSPGPLSVESQIGLFAELLFLRDHVLVDRSPAAAVNSWMGPLGRAQDFHLEQASVEVKASVGGLKQVQISSLDQLDATGCSTPLMLCWADLAFSPQPSGINLPQLVAELKGRVGKEAGLAFGERLLAAGYIAAHERHYEGRLYRLRAMAFFGVSGAFPRIERGDVRRGVISGSYVISLTGCDEFLLSESEAGRLIRGEAS